LRPLVLCYHAASATWPYRLSLPPATIERQVRRLLRRGYRAVRADDVIRGRGRRLHVTFDDAFRSVADVVPALERLGVPVTVFACSGYADDGGPLAIRELAEQAEAYPDELATMTWDELRALAERGVEIGAHTVSHAHLRELDGDELRTELEDSRARIEAELGKPCRHLAYPYGEWDDRVAAAARAAGYTAAFALLDGRPGDAFAVPRSDLYPKDDGALRFALKTEPPLARAVAAALARARR
jgi:peptidoglycan/xylan/chitin deacetylase (PgdA/CDA1 family)